MWDPARAAPALVRPGDRVRFRAVRDVATVTAPPPAAPVASGGGSAASAVVVRSAGPQTTVQDLGRPGLADLGVTASGALDRGALRRANRLVGNDAGAATFETVLGGLVIEAVGPLVVAVTGAGATLTRTTPDGDAVAVPTDAPLALATGDRLAVAAGPGFRNYVAVRGGLDVPAVLGSRATDVLSGTGPAPLAAGARLPVAAARPGLAVGFPEPPPPPPPEVTVLRYVAGPRDAWFDAGTSGLAGRDWTVAPESNRIGLRLAGRPLRRARAGELPSEGTVAGAIQVPPSGQPVLFLADHPVTGGYPVAGVVVSADLGKAAQLAPGARLRFTEIQPPLSLRS
ncbi:hypothetical protein [Specibacter cremeus]|uniref:5-oxoprolinase subunit C family protein n=1 Tax=Specibacter cremeus TaxID=1629051 RepID=UPI003B82EEA5